MEKGVPRLLACIISLAAIILIVLYQDNSNRSAVLENGSESLQTALGGMGMGAVCFPAWNFGDFDPRLQPSGYDQMFPIPGGYSYSPDRLTMISSFSDK
jgi:hypothetical protein